MAMLNILLTASVFAITAPYGLAPAKAHDWYPHDCCEGGDCAPVDNVTRIAPAGDGDTRLVLTSKLGTAIFSPYGNRRTTACMFVCDQAYTEEWASLAYLCHPACTEMAK
jgi:hypothetical protein